MTIFFVFLLLTLFTLFDDTNRYYQPPIIKYYREKSYFSNLPSATQSFKCVYGWNFTLTEAPFETLAPPGLLGLLYSRAGTSTVLNLPNLEIATDSFFDNDYMFLWCMYWYQWYNMCRYMKKKNIKINIVFSDCGPLYCWNMPINNMYSNSKMVHVTHDNIFLSK